MPSTWKTVRVFISSTFRDMHAERDHLIKVVFPALRESLLKDRIYLDDIDLRWGVTREQAENNQVLDLCLRQIDDCRPFFIGILGERYGWVPLQFPADACKSFGWIQNHPGKSVTELEILHGVLNDPAMTALAFFYLRDPAFIKDVPPERKQVYLECPTEQELRELSTEAAEACAGERRRKQHELKEKLRALRPGQFVYDGYPCHWDRDKPDPQTKQAGRIAGLEEFGESVRVNLERGISTDPKLKDHFTALAAAPPDPFGLAEEQDYHDRFMESRLRVYVGRDKINDELFAFANSNETVPCLMTGPSGSGKSAALARFVRDFQHKHSTTLVIAHFIGASPRSTNLRDMLRRFCQVLKVHFRFAEDVPEETAKLSVTFREFVGKVPADARVILVIDALNQLDETERAQELYWLPTSLLPQVKVIVSCISDSGKTVPVLDAFGRRKHCPVQLAALSDAEQREIIRQVPSLSAKTLDDGQVRLLMSNPATANPLFLLVALEELRGFAPFERLNERIAAFPREGDTVTTIFTQVIERLAVDFDEKLVETVLTLLASARRGLSERELQELVAGLDGADDLFPVLRQLRPYLLMRGGLVDFYHRNLFKAVNECYHSSETQRLKAHRALADYFESQPLHWRRAFELPWQLQKVRERDRLRRCLLDIDLFRMMAQLDEMELIRYWVWLQEERSMGGLYRDAFEKWLAQQPKPRDFSAEGFVATTLGNFLNQSGLPRDAEPVLRRALAFSVWRLPARQTEVATTLNNLARLLVELEQFDEAEDYYCWALEMYESSYGHKSSAVATCVSNLGQLYDEQGRNEDAEICLRLALALDNDLFDANGPVAARDMVNLAMLLKDTFRVSEAEPLLRRAVTIYEQQLGPNHPDVALTMSNLARLLQEDDRGAEAEPLLRRALVMNEHAFGSEHPRVGSALNNLADLLMHKNRHEDAEPYLRRALAIDEACFGPDHPRVALALNNLANCLRRAEQLPEAESMLRRALAMRDQQTAGEHQYENLIVNSLGGVLQAQGRNTEAEAMYRRALKADEAFYGPNHPKVAIRLSNLAFLRAGLGHRREADTLIQRAQDCSAPVENGIRFWSA